MKINEIIRCRRIEKALTQEQLASRLGVSASAVYKWEKAVSYPDITLLPALARLLDTDLNTLLSFKEELTEQEIGAFLNKVAADAEKNGPQHAFALAMEIIQEYPSCDKLLLCLARLLDGMFMMYPQQDGSCDQKIEELCERAAQSADSRISRDAKAVMITRYMRHKEYEKAEKLLKELPEGDYFDKRRLQINLHMERGEWDKAAAAAEHKIMAEATLLQSLLVTLAEIAQKDKREEDAERIAQASSQMTEIFDLWAYNAYIAPLQLAILKKDGTKCLAVLKDMVPAMMKAWHVSDSPLYRHIHEKQQNESLGEKMLPKILQELADPLQEEYDFLRKTEGFQAFLHMYENNKASNKIL